MRKERWIVLKSENFQCETTVIGSSMSVQDVLHSSYIDYHVSDESLKSLASMFVISKLGGQHTKNIEQLWRTHQSSCHFFHLVDGDNLVGAIIALNNDTAISTRLNSGNKLCQHLNISNLRNAKNNHKTKMIVCLTALGLNTVEISKLLNLTSRGVDYHLEKAKQRLGATNKANLVFKANQYGWL